MSQTPNYDNPEAKEQLDKLREQQKAEERTERVEEHVEAQSARRMVAAEEQPDRDEPVDLRRTYDVEFRGHTFEFYETGDAQVRAAELEQEEDEIEAGTKAAEFVYETLGDKAVDPRYDEDYWRRYDVGDVIEAFTALIDADMDVDAEDREEIEEFRGE